MSTWTRTFSNALGWGLNFLVIGVIPPGHTLLRTRFGLSWNVRTWGEFDADSMSAATLGLGCFTWNTTVRGAPIYGPLSYSADLNPPLERFVWWGCFTSVPGALEKWSTATATWWRSPDSCRVLDSEAQVKNTTGGNIDLYLATEADWLVEVGDPENMTPWASVLIS